MDDENKDLEQNTSDSAQSDENQPLGELDKRDSESNIQPKVENKTENRVIHRKDERLHIYVRQDKYKGELKSKNWVGRLYVNGKQKISSSGTQNLEEAIPILEKWFDEVQLEAQKSLNEQAEKKIIADNSPKENNESNHKEIASTKAEENLNNTNEVSQSSDEKLKMLDKLKNISLFKKNKPHLLQIKKQKMQKIFLVNFLNQKYQN